ncbi:MAG: hypothetical protein MJZ16_01070 [Bacteroidales bacterium]|nr:hypothetical protein [Bacteroidales bacterium]
MRCYAPLVLLTLGIISGCGTHRKISYLDENGIVPSLAPSFNDSVPEIDKHIQKRDTIKVNDLDGNEVIIMKAIKDENGEMVATDVLSAATITAKFRNVAERHGKIDIAFLVTIPQSMQDSRWQIRISPLMKIFEDYHKLEPVIITGNNFRKTQMKGYAFYDKFLSSIITDPSLMVHQTQLDHFIERTLPELYKFKNDTTMVDSPEALMSSPWGVTQKEALEHFSKNVLRRHNDRKKREIQRKFDRYVKVPIISDGIRLDTVITSQNGDFIYEYVQTINTQPELRKVEITLSGGIYEQDTKVWDIPKSDPLPFYISSISSLTDDNVRYLTRTVSRRVEANTESNIDFRSGDFRIDSSLGNNLEEISRIRHTLASLIQNQEYDVDSIIVQASCSPEGRFSSNRTLSQRRSESVSSFFENFIRSQRDSLNEELSRMVTLDKEFTQDQGYDNQIKFISRSYPENWDDLSKLVRIDSIITSSQKEDYFETLQVSDPDKREKILSTKEYYKHVTDNLYPKLRTVQFRFFLHRKGMVQDFIETTVVDSVYMSGVQAIRDRNYETAISILRPYRDFNTAIAYSCLDYNASAIDVLNDLDRKDDKSEYMLAILHSRIGNVEKAVQHFLNACSMNPAMVYRGNLDPEISALIKLYDLHLYDSDDEFNY